MRAHSSSNSAAVVRWLRLKIAATAPTADIEWWWWWCGGGVVVGSTRKSGQQRHHRHSSAARCAALRWCGGRLQRWSCLGFGWRGGDHPTAPQQHHSNLFAVRAAAALMGTTADDQISSPVQRSVQRSANIHHVVQDRYKWETTTLFGESSKDISPR